ncbi:MAG: DUF3014 domain-containing protein [Burkholderiales bacterium]|nr:DUF3014 domain-containing protein [Burkholderiales bacterium]
MKRLWIVLVTVLALVAIGAYFWLRQAPQQLPPAVPVVPPPAIAPPPATIPPEPAIKFPVPAPPGMTRLPPLEQADDFVKEQVTDLFGAKTVLADLQLDNFVRRVVATVDNLARPLAPPSRWPIHPTPGRFSVETVNGASVIGTANAARYLPFVALVEAVDSERAVALYRQLYPLFQSAYESLGYPGKYFNDRLIAVIDLLLDTPEPAGALPVEVPEIRGPLKPTRLWLLYRFSDPALEGLSSGQKILLRVGTENRRRLKSKLAEIRKLIAQEKAGR